MLIFLDFKYSKSYHDVTILHQFELHQSWCQFFVHDDEYFEYLFGNLGHLSKKNSSWRGRWEVGPNSGDDAIKAYNNMHVKYIVWMEWRISGLKRKWKWLMKIFDSTKPKYIHLFKVVAILTNFLHRCYMDFTFEVISEQMPNPTGHGWDGDF